MKKIIKIVTHIFSLLSLAVLVFFSGLLGRSMKSDGPLGGVLSKIVPSGPENFSVPRALADAPPGDGLDTGGDGTGDDDGGGSDCDTSDGSDTDGGDTC